MIVSYGQRIQNIDKNLLRTCFMVILSNSDEINFSGAERRVYAQIKIGLNVLLELATHGGL